jgi:chromosome partitioning protein
MKSIAFFNNKGGVGKTSLVYHLAWMLADLGKRVIAIDLDPQSNLTTAFFDDEQLEKLWNSDGQTVYKMISPLVKGTGDINNPTILQISDNLGILPGDLKLSRFEDQLSENWHKCLGGDERAFRVESCFWRLLDQAGRDFKADVAFIDVGPNLGAINRSAMIAADHVVIPLAPDLFSLQGMKNLGPTLREWRYNWNDRLKRRPQVLDINLPNGEMSPIGYILMRHSIRLDRPTMAFERWIDMMPGEYLRSVLNDENSLPPKAKDDPYCLDILKDYRSLMPMAHEAKKPIFHLTAADGAIGAHYQYVKSAREDFEKLARRIAVKISLEI